VMTQVLVVQKPEAEFEQYLEKQATAVIAPSLVSLFGSTASILQHAFWLQERKKALSKKDYRHLLEEHGWQGEEKRYLKVAIAFEQFTAEELCLIEPRTIFQLAENRNKYQPVIEAMRNLETINQSAVRELIQQQRKTRLPKPEEKPTIWRQTGSGPRYVQIPPLHEQDEQTGLTLQQMIESEGLTAQTILREAIALRQAYKAGRLVEIENLSLDVEETDVACRQESEAILLQDEATELEIVTPEQPALFVLQTESQPTERKILPQPPTLSREEKSLFEMGMLGEEEFGDGEAEPTLALKNSEDRVNQIQHLIEEYQTELDNGQSDRDEDSRKGRISLGHRYIKVEIKGWQEQKKREIWQAHQFAIAASIKLEVYEISNGDCITYEYRNVPVLRST